MQFPNVYIKSLKYSNLIIIMNQQFIIIDVYYIRLYLKYLSVYMNYNRWS